MTDLDLLKNYRAEARRIGVFLPLADQEDAIFQTAELGGVTLPSRAVLQMQNVFDADENGAPTQKTIERYCAAVRERQYSILWLEPAAITPEGRRAEGQLILNAENSAAFTALLEEVRKAAKDAFGTAPLMVALPDHAGQFALEPFVFENRKVICEAEPAADEAVSALVVVCANAAKAAEDAGFDYAALNVCGKNLFGESLTAFHRDGRFGGDFDDRSRFVRDCYTAAKMLTERIPFAIRLSLADGIAQPDGWGMTPDSDAPDIYEPALLLKILQALYGVELVSCEIGIPGINWMEAEAPEPELLRVSRLCTCIAMLDSDMQQNVQLILPELPAQEIPFAPLAAGMIEGEFASFAGYAG